MRFRLMTWNIHKGIGGVDRSYRPQRIVDAIAHCDPDIAMLQEVDDGVPRSRFHRQVDYLGDALKLPHRAYQRNVTLSKGHYGNAILSRYPLHDISHLDLTVPLKKKRRGLCAHCRLHINGRTRTVVLFNCHLGLAAFERRMQLRRFIESDQLKHTRKNTPFIICGDFNDVWGNLGRQILESANFRLVAKSTKTFPAILPVRPLDRICCRGDIEIKHSFASRTKITRQASDHLPLVADFSIE